MPKYGRGTTDQATAPDVAPPGGIADGEGADHYWTEDGTDTGTNKPMSKVVVTVLAGADARARVKWNAVATSSNFDRELSAGQSCESPEGILVTRVDIYADGALTYPTEYSIMGWE